MSVIIRLQNLPMSANASNIRRFFSGLAIPEGGVHIVGGNDGDAFIAFATDEDARKAMLLDRQSINGAPVRLFLSSKTEMQSIIDSARSSALFSGAASAQSPQPSKPQKTETMQALDVTAPTLPSSFPSYRNGSVRERQDQYAYNHKHGSPPPGTTNLSRAQFEASGTENYGDTSAGAALSRLPEPLPRSRDYDFDRQSATHYMPYDGSRERPPLGADFASSTREHVGFESTSRTSPQLYRSLYTEPVYDRRATDNHYPSVGPKNGPRDELGETYVDPRYSRLPMEHSFDDGRPSKSHPERLTREVTPREALLDVGTMNEPYTQDRRTVLTHYDHEPSLLPPRCHNERDFSVRPPWLSEDAVQYGPKRPLQPPADFEDYPRKRRVPPPPTRVIDNAPTETEFVVRVTIPIPEVRVKTIFEVLGGVQIVAKWGIRIEEDALQRPTGYVFIMVTARDSYDRALTCDGRFYKGKPIKVVPSTLAAFYSVTDSTFHLRCPPELTKKLPPVGQNNSAPHHADGCLEVAELPPDTSRAEIVRFLGAPGLSTADVTIAAFAPSDKSASKTPGSVRALVALPSAKDLDILLSAKPRPLRPDGAFPPVRLTSISRQQLETYSLLRVDEKVKVEPPKAADPVTPTPSVVEDAKTATTRSLTCAYLSGLSRFLKDSEVLRLFPSVLIPGDAIRMVGPDNERAYIDFISENNCRRALADLNAADSKARISHPDIRIEAITRAEMESRLSVVYKNEDIQHPSASDHRPSRPPRDRDPRDAARPPWESRPPPRVGRHMSPVPSFRPRSPPVQTKGRQSFEEPYYEHISQQTFEDVHRGESYISGPLRRSRPPVEMKHSGPPPSLPPAPMDFVLPSRPIESVPPPRRPGLDFVTVHIGNLPPSVTVDQLAGIMRDYYFVPGSIRLRRDIQGMPTGEGLVDFNSTYDGDRIIRDLNGYRIGGRPLILQYDRRL
ncbi:uncharacterized protein DEA37_0010660 [Paragonimus westermani]|uniref:RRM domain-containing protein n=1 Tax=Paragonimus westermani TaxID=34504 RepID=A0A5J4NA53_9TREM|nr:uncharacterized protein DEA37_0010660 [Paragonimus westermani]